MPSCPICNNAINAKEINDEHHVTCPSCGKYIITHEALEDFRAQLSRRPLNDRQKANISGWLSENQPYKINTTNLEILLKIKTPSFHERADKILLALQKDTEYIGHPLVRSKEWIRFGWCINEDELLEFLRFLVSTGRIESINFGSAIGCKIIADGWAHLEGLKKINADSQQGFVAMWFNDENKEMNNAYDMAISEGILDAGYKPLRVDKKDHNNRIDDEIIAQIKQSRFILADFTGHRGGVYFEAGYAMGLGIEIFWTCREDAINDLHFDIRQYNCIKWSQDKLDAFKTGITNRIKNVIGQGTYQRE